MVASEGQSAFSGLYGSGGEEGIRTLEKLLTSTPLAGERLRPLGHLSGARWIKKSAQTINRRNSVPQRK